MPNQKVAARVKSRLEEAQRQQNEQQHIHVISHLRAYPDRAERLKTVLQSLVTPVRQEPGCVSYDLLQCRDDPSEFVVLQHWASRDQYDAHMKSQHMYDAMAQMDNLNLLAELPDIRFYTLLS
jgi:quinol monooxygenase YgiN